MNTEIIITALSKIGLHESPGTADNLEILQLAQEAGFGATYTHDDISWCSMFMNWVAKKCKMQASGALNARSWLLIGTMTKVPEMGDVAILWRDSPSSWQGHVGIFIREDASNYYLLGGNQGDAVSIMPFPKNRLLGFRRLNKI